MKGKKIFIYALLTIYLSAQFKPLVSVIDDLVAHTFFRLEHMASVHYENGHYHLHHELEKEAKQQEKSFPSEKSGKNDLTPHTNSFTNQLVVTEEKKTLFHWHPPCLLSGACKDIPYPPPEIS